MCVFVIFEKLWMQLSQQPKELERCGWCHSIELFKLYNRFFENILMQSLTPLAASVSEIINVKYFCHFFINFQQILNRQYLGHP